MVLDPELHKQARQLFVEEALELLQYVRENLLELDEDPTSSPIENLLEDVRLVVDGALEVELTDLYIAVSPLENILLSFGNLSKEKRAGSIERLQTIYQEIWLALLPLLPGYQTEPNTRILEVKSPTMTNRLQLDLVETIVRVDFPAALKRLTKILNELSGDLLVNELKACAEFFLNIGEILQLPESIAIAETTITTLQTNPEFAQAIGTSALADWRKVYQIALDRAATQFTISKNELQSQAQPIVEKQTISTVKSWLWLSGFNLCVLPVDSIEEIINYSAEQIVKSDERLFVYWQQRKIEFYRISQLLNYNCFLVERSTEATLEQQFHSGESLQMPIVNLNGNAIALEPEVDRFIVKSKVTIEPFGSEMSAPNYLLGCTILEDNLLVPVIDVKALLLFHLQTTQENDLSSIAAENEMFAAPRILIIDDSKTMREILALTLEKEGYRVIKAENGRTAIAKLQQNRQLNAIISDLEMPDINGFEFLRYRSQHPAIARIPTIILTTHNSNDYRQLAFKLGATDYFTIPYSETEFLTLLKIRIRAKLS